MKRYTSEKPEFSEAIQIVEEGDPVNAKNNNEPIEQLLQNTLAIKNFMEEVLKTGDVLTGLTTENGSRFVTADGNAYRALKKLQFK